MGFQKMVRNRSIQMRVSKDFVDLVNFIIANRLLNGKPRLSSQKITSLIARRFRDKENLRRGL